MKKLHLILLVCFVSANFFACKKEAVVNPVKTITLTEKAQTLVNSGNNFSFGLFKQIIQADNGTANVMISPLSVSFALGMTYNGADGSTKTAMTNTLGFAGLTTDDINKNYQYLMNALMTVDNNVNMQVANSLWYRNTFPVLQSFIDVNKQYFSAEVAALDFTNPNSVNTINNWVSAKTNNKIPTIIENIDANAVMFLINAIYFKATWKYKFEESATQNAAFTLVDGTAINVPTMNMKATLNYADLNDFEAVEMVYGNGNYGMLVLLPHVDKNTNDVVNQLTVANLNNSLTTMTNQSISIHFPKFKFSFDQELSKALTSLGMGIAFTDTANFNNIYNCNCLQISKVKHKTFIEVNEAGTEAAAVTSVEIIATSVGPGYDTKQVYINRPFIFIIRERETNAVLFIGKVINPLI